MPIGLDILSGFLATLLATLIGVYIAFVLDRWQQEKRNRQRAVEHLHSIQSEIQLNSSRLDSNSRILDELQQRDRKGDHYILESLETDAWESALQEPIVGTLSPDLYDRLQELYYGYNSVNSLIERQTSEMHHKTLGEERGVGGYSYENWTMTVDYYDRENEEVDFLGLGSLIRNSSQNLRGNRDLQDDIDEEIEKLESYSLRDHMSTDWITPWGNSNELA